MKTAAWNGFVPRFSQEKLSAVRSSGSGERTLPAFLLPDGLEKHQGIPLRRLPAFAC